MRICTKGHHFPREVILVTVRWYLSYGLSYRELEEMQKERGYSVDHSTISRWVKKFGPQMEKVVRKQRRKPGLSWRVDETYVKVKGETAYLYRAVDKEGNTVDYLLTRKRDSRAAKRFFKKALKSSGKPEKITVDGNKANIKAANYIKEKHGKDIEVRNTKYLNNIVEQDHRGIKRLTKHRQNFRSFHSARRTLGGMEAMRMLHKKQFCGDYEDRVDFFQKVILTA